MRLAIICAIMTVAAMATVAAGPASRPRMLPLPPGPVGPTGGIISGSSGGVGASIGVGPGPSSPWGGKEIDEPDPRLRFQKLLSLASDLYLRGQYYDALQAALRAEPLIAEAAQAQDLRKVLVQIEAVGQEWLRKHQDQYEQGDFVAAIKGLGIVSRTFGTLPSGVTAKKLLDRLEGQADVRSALQEVKAQELAEVLDAIIDCPTCRPTPATGPSTRPTQPAGPTVTRYADASRLEHIRKLEPDRQLKAFDTIERLAKLYPLSPTGTVAAADVKALLADAAFKASIDAQRSALQAQGLFNAGETFRLAGNAAKAAEYYERIIAQHPRSPLAAKAREALASLK